MIRRFGAAAAAEADADALPDHCYASIVPACTEAPAALHIIDLGGDPAPCDGDTQ
jgi:hypothetical protein